MPLKGITVTLIILSTSLTQILCQSNFGITMQLLTPILSKTNLEGKKFCSDRDSIISFNDNAWKRSGPTTLWIDLKPFHPRISLLYNNGQLSELLICDVIDTTSLSAFSNANNVEYCGLFKTRVYSWTGHENSGWDVHLKFKNDKINTSKRCQIETWDSTSYYLEVIKNPIYVYNYGVACYEGGEPPLGRYAIYYLQRKNLITAITNVKEIENNEGLMFIAEYYVRNNLELPDGFDAVLNKKFNYCDGCTEFGSSTIGKMMKEIKDGTSTFSGYFMDDNW